MRKWVPKALRDSDFASDKETRISYLDMLSISVEYQLRGEAKE